MPTPVYVALHGVAINLEPQQRAAHQQLVTQGRALPDYTAISKAYAVAGLIRDAYRYLVLEATNNNEQANALYVYLGPEYLLQESYEQVKSVTEEVKNQIVALMMGASAACQGMLTVPGTVLWRKKKGFQRALLRQAADAFNTAFVFWNGQIVHLHHKQQDVAELRDMDKTKGRGFFEHPRARFVAGTHTGHFTCANVNWGIEICGDHTIPVLAQGQQVDIHLLTSAAVSHDFTNQGLQRIAARDGGVFIHCDESAGFSAQTTVHGVWEIDRLANQPANLAQLLGGAPPQQIRGYRATLQ